MAEKSSDDFQKLDDLDQLLNSALNELNNPSTIKESESKKDEKSDDLSQLNDQFKKLLHPSNDQFDETMLETIRKLEENMKGLPEDVDSSDLPSEEEMAKIWEQMTNQTDGDEQFPPFFLDIMQKLLAKDVLYPPLKDLSTKFPDWLKNNEDKLSDEDFKRYSKQHELVDQVCKYYEEDESESGTIENKRFQNILTTMQEMQQCGQPPEDLVQNNGQNNFQPTSMEDFNKLMEEGAANMDQCKTM